MVGVAQLVEPRVVIPVVVGSSPIVHPIFFLALRYSSNEIHGVAVYNYSEFATDADESE